MDERLARLERQVEEAPGDMDARLALAAAYRQADRHMDANRVLLSPTAAITLPHVADEAEFRAAQPRHYESHRCDILPDLALYFTTPRNTSAEIEIDLLATTEYWSEDLIRRVHNVTGVALLLEPLISRVFCHRPTLDLYETLVYAWYLPREFSAQQHLDNYARLATYLRDNIMLPEE